MMKATDWDRVITSAPLNKDAALARDGRGEHWTPLAKVTNCYDTPPPMKPYNPAVGENLTGRRFQSVVVLGLSTLPNSKGQASWACRCDCGKYARFSTKSLEVCVRSGIAACGECNYVAAIKAGGGKTPLQRKLRAERAEQRVASLEERHALVHPPLAALVEQLVTATGLSRAAVLRSMTRYIQLEGEKENKQAAEARSP